MPSSRLAPISPARRVGVLFCFVLFPRGVFSCRPAPRNGEKPALTSRPLFSQPSQEPEKYESHFSKYHAEDFDPTELEDAMEGVLDAIRGSTHEKKERKKPADAKSWKPKKMTYEERKANLKAKLEPSSPTRKRPPFRVRARRRSFAAERDWGCFHRGRGDASRRR